MGFLSNLISKAAGLSAGGKMDQNVISGILNLLNSSKVGGIQGIAGKLSNSGLGNMVESWISTGKNQPISTDQVNNALGNDVVDELSTKLGVSKGDAASKLAQYLPTIIDKLTPDGKVSASKQINLQDAIGAILKK